MVMMTRNYNSMVMMTKTTNMVMMTSTYQQHGDDDKELPIT